MRKIAYSLLLLFICTAIMAQTNTFPTSGNVGIGTTTPSKLLDVQKSAAGGLLQARFWNNTTNTNGTETQIMMPVFNGTSGLYIRSMGSSGGGFNVGTYDGWIHTGQSASRLHLSGGNGSTKHLTIRDNGNIGIGTTSPNDLLHISKSGANTRLRIGNNSAYDQLLYFNGAADWSMGMDNSNSNAFTIAATSSLDNSQRFTILNNGNTGIGTTSPSTKLYVDNGTSTFNRGNSSGQIAAFRGLNSEQVSIGTEDSYFLSNIGIGTTNPSHTLTVQGGPTGAKGINIMDGNSRIYFDGRRAMEGHDGTSRLDIAEGFGTTQIFGNVGIGVINPSEKLEVNGNALIDGELYSKKVKVSINPGNWPDFVFASGYELRSLNALEKFIADNHHLPEVPSAAAIEKEGLDLGKMDATLLQKVEELTLYLIDVNKKQEQLIKEVENLKKENEALKKKVKEQ
ncbi:hypothetical protein BFP97_10740 [Roseivirga sp. 4D4]|uniref:hypothetical protein n=1 Tax=Roseivirga sp. 4D4 TaxID=1889784 RepID=UPI0008531860|nr:hypothetical protein [Roseivirga sp. 4D4]OEK01965.1 hypothetical protein BFP97_10740 [Roseivirga sp. 4D4]